MRELVNKFIDWISGKAGKRSGEIAANRMKLMVVHDRYQLPPAAVEQVKQELVNIASQYFEIDPEAAECVIKSQGQRRAVITASVPLLAGPALNDNASNSNKKSPRKNKTNLSASAA